MKEVCLKDHPIEGLLKRIERRLWLDLAPLNNPDLVPCCRISGVNGSIFLRVINRPLPYPYFHLRIYQNGKVEVKVIVERIGISRDFHLKNLETEREVLEEVIPQLCIMLNDGACNLPTPTKRRTKKHPVEAIIDSLILFCDEEGVW